MRTKDLHLYVEYTKTPKKLNKNNSVINFVVGETLNKITIIHNIIVN